mgnify:CR=1 FL=1
MKKAKGPTLARQNNDAILKNPAWHKAACVKKTVGVFVQTACIAAGRLYDSCALPEYASPFCVLHHALRNSVPLGIRRLA